MQKKIIALAIAAAFAAPVAMADTANVNVYGVVNVSADNVHGLSAAVPAGALGLGTYESRGRVSSNNSFIGFKGTEDLGDGLSAVWQYETAVAFDLQSIDNTGSSAITGGQSKRNTFAGVSDKSLGTLTFGLIDSPLKTSTGPVTEFTNTLADFRTLFTTNATSTRPASSALYVSPSMSGLVLRVMTAAQNEAGNNVVRPDAVSSRSDPSFVSFSTTYTAGSIFFVMAGEHSKTVSAPTASTALPERVGIRTRPGTGIPGVPAVRETFILPAQASNATIGGEVTETRANRVGFGYTLGDAKMGVATEYNGVTNPDGIKSTSVRSTYVSASYKIGINTLKASYTKRGDETGLQTRRGAAKLAESGATQWAIGVDRAMSKRTTVYALATNLTNDVNGTFSLAGGATGIASVGADKGGNARGVSFGMVHTF